MSTRQLWVLQSGHFKFIDHCRLHSSYKSGITLVANVVLAGRLYLGSRVVIIALKYWLSTVVKGRISAARNILNFLVMSLALTLPGAMLVANAWPMLICLIRRGPAFRDDWWPVQWDAWETDPDWDLDGVELGHMSHLYHASSSNESPCLRYSLLCSWK